MRAINLTFALVCLGVFQIAHAEVGVGNGGIGVEIGGKLFLLDLVEAGVETEPFFEKDVELNPSIVKRVDLAFADQRVPTKWIALKLSSMYQKDRFFALSVLRAMEKYSWHIVPRELVKIPIPPSTIKIGDYPTRVIAIRYGRTIRIFTKVWDELDEKNKVALVFHEAIYSLVRPKRLLDREEHYFFQESAIARDLVGYLFSPQYGSKGQDGLRSIVAGAFPYQIEGGKFKDAFDSIDFSPRLEIEFRYSGAVYTSELNLAYATKLELNSFAEAICTTMGDRFKTTYGIDARIVSKRFDLKFADYWGLEGSESPLPKQFTYLDTSFREIVSVATLEIDSHVIAGRACSEILRVELINGFLEKEYSPFRLEITEKGS